MSKRKERALVNIELGNMVMSAKDDAKERNMLIDATQGGKTRYIIITDSDQVILSAVRVETLTQRFYGGEGA